MCILVHFCRSNLSFNKKKLFPSLRICFTVSNSKMCLKLNERLNKRHTSKSKIKNDTKKCPCVGQQVDSKAMKNNSKVS